MLLGLSGRNQEGDGDLFITTAMVVVARLWEVEQRIKFHVLVGRYLWLFLSASQTRGILNYIPIYDNQPLYSDRCGRCRRRGCKSSSGTMFLYLDFTSVIFSEGSSACLLRPRAGRCGQAEGWARRRGPANSISFSRHQWDVAQISGNWASSATTSMY